MIENEIVNKAIEYIMQHISEEIRLEDVADYCHFSKFYFSRMFKEETGESIYAFIKRVKMEQSAFRLKVERGKSITDIGYDYGYSPSNYSSVFKQVHNASPANFRKNIYEQSMKHPFIKQLELPVWTYEECNKNITIETFPDYKVIYERRIGSYYNLGTDWSKFIKKYEKYCNKDSLMIERTFDDPSITDIDTCLYDICISINEDCPLENTCTIQGGKFVVYHFCGHVHQIYATYQNLFNVWFPQSHYEIDERYGFDIYRDIDCFTMNTVMDICFPVK